MKVFGYDLTLTKQKVRSYDPTRNLFSIPGLVGNKPVTEKTALSLSAYWAGVRIISETIAKLPVDVVKKVGNTRQQVDHPSEYLLNSEANYKAIAFDFTQILITSAINHGNGLAIIERDNSGTPIGLINVRKDTCECKDYDGEIWWKVRIDEKESIMVNDRDMINLRGFGTHPIEGLSAIAYHKINLGLSLAAQEYGADFYNKGTRIDGYLKFDGELDTDRKEKIGLAWRTAYGPNGTKGTAILDSGVDYVRLGLPPEDAQFIETRKFQKNEIATILGIPAHLINELEHATFSNIEHQGIEFVNYCLGSWITRLEQEYRRKLLKIKEKRNHYFKFNVNALLRTDVKTKAEYYRLMLDNGVYSINDVLALEDKNPIENGDEHYVQLNRIPIGKINNYYDNQPNNTPPSRSIKRDGNKSVSFDFDGTLDRSDVQDYASKLVKNGINVYICSSRPTKAVDNSDIYGVAKELGINENNVILTSYNRKVDYLMDINAIWHLDNDTTEIKDIRNNSNILAIDVADDNWEEQCDKLL